MTTRCPVCSKLPANRELVAMSFGNRQTIDCPRCELPTPIDHLPMWERAMIYAWHQARLSNPKRTMATDKSPKRPGPNGD